jgi:hypothetical protein
MAKNGNGNTLPAVAEVAPKKPRASKSRALISMAEIEKQYASEAVAAANAAPVAEGAPRISAKDQQFTVGEHVLPDPLEVIVVAEALVNIYYTEDYDPENPAPPACFALAPVLETDAAGQPVEGTGEAGLHAHPTSPDIQGGENNHDCLTCEKNKFGSAEKGAGKACGNTRQLAVVMADDPAFTGGGELRYALLSLSPTALKSWGKYVKGLKEVVKRPPHGVITQFSFNKQDPNERARKAVVPKGYKPITAIEVATKVNALRSQLLTEKTLLRPLPVEVRATPKPAAKGRRGKASVVAKAKAKAKANAEPTRTARF